MKLIEIACVSVSRYPDGVLGSVASVPSAFHVWRTVSIRQSTSTFLTDHVGVGATWPHQSRSCGGAVAAPAWAGRTPTASTHETDSSNRRTESPSLSASATGGG